MQIANPSVQGEQRASAVEVCSCPVGYAGSSCEVYSRNALQCAYSLCELSVTVLLCSRPVFLASEELMEICIVVCVKLAIATNMLRSVTR